VHDNLKDLKLEVPPEDTTLTMRDEITRWVQWRRTSIDVGPSVVTSASTTLSQLNTAPALIFPETRPSPSLIQEEPHPSPIQEESCHLQFESSRIIDLHLRLGVKGSSRRCRPRQQRASNN
jgi:hypothetical protein